MIGLGKVSLIGLGVVAGVASVVSFGGGHRVSQEHGRPASMENNVAPVMGVHLVSAAQSTRQATAAEPTAVLTADTDIRQLRAGYTIDDTTWYTINGPFVLTDLLTTNGVTVYVVSAGTDCSRSLERRVLDAGHDVHVKIPIPSGSVACLSASSGTTWSGFVPY